MKSTKQPDKDCFFILNYYNPDKPNAKTKKTEKVTHQELVGKLVCTMIDRSLGGSSSRT